MSEQHAAFPPSGAAGWVQCAMWATMMRLYPELDGDPDASAEGVAFHWLCHVSLLGHPNVHIATGDEAPNGTRITEEMQQGLDVVFGAIGDKLTLPGLRLEGTMKNDAIHATLNWGTPDARSFAGMQLNIWDWKYGHGYVDVFENWQLINYAALALRELRIEPPTDETVVVHLHVVQPRFYGGLEGPHRTWTIRASDLRPYFNILRGAIDKALDPKPVATTGSACRYCPGRIACEANHRSASYGIEVSHQSVPLELPPDAIGNELRMLWAAQDRLKSRIAGLEEQAKALWREGKQVAHTRIENVVGREQWKRPIEEVIAMGSLMGIDLANPGVVTPRQARMKGLPSSLTERFAGTEGMGTALKLDNGSTARKVFK